MRSSLFFPVEKSLKRTDGNVEVEAAFGARLADALQDGGVGFALNHEGELFEGAAGGVGVDDPGPDEVRHRHMVRLASEVHGRIRTAPPTAEQPPARPRVARTGSGGSFR